MATSGKSQASRHLVLAANVTRILAELHQLAAANGSKPLANSRSGSSIPPAIVIRGK